ncbi:MAG: hypothetical protein ACQPRI_05955 [Solitalea-like symbiont of Tyrophagus putrescentiae]
MQNKMGITLTPKTTYTKSILIVVIFFIALLLVLFTATLHSQERPSVKSEGIALSVDVPGGDKGIILPKIELTDLSQYSPIKGQERDGLIIENTRVDATKGLSRGLYMWHEGRWDKLLTYRDVPEISGGTRVYTGTEDPNQSTLPELVNAPNGSIYINKTTKIIFKKTDKNWTNELSIQGTSYTGSNTIAIKDDTSGSHLEAIAGAGIKLTEQGIAASIDSSTLTINQQGINAKNSEALWNANKLQGTTLETTTPSQGQTLRYDTSKKSWVPGNVKELPDGASEGQLLVWTGSVWSPQVSQKVDIKGNDIHFSGLTGYPPNGAYRDLLVIDSNGKVQRSFGNLWDLSGNKDPIGLGNDHILGFTDTTSTSNIVFKTKNAERIRISSDGKVDIKTPNAYLSGLSGSSSQNTASDYILMTDNSGKLKRWSGTVWDASGNSNITSGNKILGFTDTTSTANIVFRTKNTDRLSISSDGKVDITSSDVYFSGTQDTSTDSNDSLMVLDSNKKVKKLALANLWNLGGNTNESGTDKVLGFTNGSSVSNIVFRTKNTDRISIASTGAVDIKSANVIFSGLIGSASHIGYDYTLQLDTKGNVVKRMGLPWHPSGNNVTGEQILGSTGAATISFKTNNATRMVIDSTGKVDIKSSNVYLSGLNGSTRQNTDTDYMLMTDSSGKLKRWNGMSWSAKGNRLVTGKWHLGFTSDSSQASLAFITKNKERIIINAEGKVEIKGREIFLPDLASSIAEAPLIVDKTGKLKLGRSIMSTISPNKSLKVQDEILGFTDPKSTFGLIFKTQDIDRMRIESNGNIEFKTPNTYFTGIKDQSQNQGDTDNILLLDSTGRLTKWNGRGWDMKGNPTTQGDQIIGFNDPASAANLVFRTQNADRFRIEANGNIELKAKHTYFTGINDESQRQRDTDNFLLLDSAGRLTKWNGRGWDMKGNANVAQGNQTLGFTDPKSTANLSFKTKNTERMRIESTGKVDIKSNDVYLSGLSGSSSQNTVSDYILMSDNSGKLKRWSGTAWDASGNSNITSGNKILGFTDTASTANILFRTRNTDRLRITASGDIEVRSTKTYFNTILNDPDSKLGSGRILFVDAAGKLTKLDPDDTWNNKNRPGAVQSQVKSAKTIDLIKGNTNFALFDQLGLDGELTINILETSQADADQVVLEAPIVAKVGYTNTNINGVVGVAGPSITYAYYLSQGDRINVYKNSTLTQNISIENGASYKGKLVVVVEVTPQKKLLVKVWRHSQHEATRYTYLTVRSSLRVNN